ncbi:MAG: AI-2E family transporter [Candidatus Paceibacterota bacterium]|jgi:predicted PurR-regulated permease PerM|nr:AI-2E family transporter [Candidatus Paceibacterota bacterium]MDD4201699.1 AI-2E family transporter [Candidatus Paceibacterota bacterium]MDD4897372.1 AI-2E family transporter [Candidatus Paceibacterota bacterium]
MEERKLLDISWGTIFRILFVVVSFYLVFLIRDILIWVIFALIISVLFNPVIDFLTRKMIPRVLSVVFVYLVFFGLLALAIYSIAPLFVNEVKNLLQSLPSYFEAISPFLSMFGFKTTENIQEIASLAYSSVEQMTNNIFSALIVVFGGFFSGFFVIATAFFLSLEKGIVEKGLTVLFPKNYENYILTIWKRCEKKVAGWFAVRVIVSFFVGVASYIVFLLFNIDYPLSLGLLSGFLNFIPYIGPAVMGLFLFFIIFPIDPLKGLFVILAFVLIQQIEGGILTPILMKRIIGIPPVIVLISLVIGGKLWGLLGAILVIPLVAILFEFLKEFLEKKRERESVGL